MRLLTHRMAGFNYLSGTFHLNFAELPGLVAITGGNGQGKTSLALEGPLAGLFGPGAVTKAFASREGNLARYATSREAFIEDTWDLGGKVYRVRVNVDGERRTTDAILAELLADGTQLPHGDGKTSTYKDAVAKLFPSQRSLLAGPFAGQTRRGSFGELGQKERMELFVELADLAYLEQRATTCRRCAEVAAAVVAQLRAALAALRMEVENLTPVLVENRLSEIAQLRTAQEQIKSGATDLLKLAEADRDRLQGEAQRHAAAVAKLSGELQQVGSLETRVKAIDTAAPARTRDAAVRNASARLGTTLDALVGRRADLQQQHDKATASRNERIRNNEGLLADADRINGSVAAAEKATADIARYTEAEIAARANYDTALANGTEARAQLQVARQAVSDLSAVEKRAALLDTVKFGADCGVPPVCPLVTDAVEARDRAEALRLAAAPVPELNESAAHWNQECMRHSAEIQTAQGERRKAEQRLAATKADTQRAPYLQAAQQRIDEYRADQQQADGVLARALEGLAAEKLAAKEAQAAEARAAEEQCLQAQEQVSAQLAQLREELATLQATVAASRRQVEELAGAPVALATATTAVSEAQAAIALADRTLATLATEEQHLLQQRERLARLHARDAELEGRLHTAESKQLAWSALAQRLGRDGLQRLEIDAAGPVVSEIANQLLEVGWGPRFTVAIVTQVATADGKDMKEKFTIEVLDNLHGGEPRDIGDLSGGERVVVEEAIRAALACYSNRRTQCRTIWRDEADGGLDDEKGERYILMLRKLRELSGAEQVVFITHRPDLAAMADATVRVHDGAVQSIVRSAA